mmetsp:Transcript_25913/g.31596  ORF Transcript_25913/g.31596 Transcript_25913/m.31596 type:complete len:144 (+) Transcript_25913:54-485(+)|eukprot:CAMPEP_0114664710 /NCGR_PEP_ID=MMETSP0191-20121206/29311_1 /TAXON_ID=126664 /ORGANISM="Sorites sp." /LENGTH=143 /DNA_ID=CAMNT_0001907587 /DNA_START=54 /DNA_END=485 /DNA_ORIENTATION=+
MAGLTEFEKKEFQDGFKLLDKDGDGKISFEDLSTQLTALKFKYTKQQMIDLVYVATGKKNGMIAWNQFLGRFHHKDQGELEREIQTAFEVIAGDDVKISKYNLKDFYTAVGMEATDEELDEIMDMAGTNGKLSKEEFVKMLHV